MPRARRPSPPPAALRIPRRRRPPRLSCVRCSECDDARLVGDMQLSSVQLALLGAAAIGTQWLLTQDFYRQALALPQLQNVAQQLQQAALGAVPRFRAMAMWGGRGRDVSADRSDCGTLTAYVQPAEGSVAAFGPALQPDEIEAAAPAVVPTDPQRCFEVPRATGPWQLAHPLVSSSCQGAPRRSVGAAT